MAWSYSGNPAASVKDAVRFEVQDTNEEAQLLQDEEIIYSISQEARGATPSGSEVLAASAHCLEALARKFAQVPDTETGSRRIEANKRAEAFTKRAQELRRRAQGMHSPWTIQYLGEKEAYERSTQLIKPLFRRKQFNIPFVGPNVPPFPAGVNTEEER